MHRSYDECPSCQKPKRKGSSLCRACRYKTGETRICRKCHRDLPIASFRMRTRANPKPRSYCRECEASHQRNYYESLPRETRKASTRDWEARNPDKLRAQQWRRRIRLLGLESDMSRILELLEHQTHCSICGATRGEKRFAIDHDHVSGRFRGLICEPCNLAIGLLGDGAERARRLASYLEEHSGPRPL